MASNPVTVENTVCRSGWPARRIFFLILLSLTSFFLLFPGFVWSADTYRDHLLAMAREKRLSDHRYWDILLHYKTTRHGRVSLIDDPNFFLSPQGKSDPEAELEATLDGFFRDAALDDDHPQCRFIGRYEWLRKELSLDMARLPAVSCGNFDAAMKLIDPRSAVLIFPATHNNSPTSMFGHTLLRIDGSSKNDLLSFAVNYAAMPNDKIGILYAFKGIFGFYPGYYSVLPYYEKVKDYAALEHRDIWEYRLNLTADETRRLALHVWELQNIYSDYFFFDENCAYNLLFLLEAARPSLHLADTVGRGTSFWVIPADTIRTVRENSLVESTQYRPSQATIIEALSETLAYYQRDLARNIGRGESSPAAVTDPGMSLEERMRVLDLAAEYLQYRASKREIDQETYARLFLAVLQKRSELGQSTGNVYSIAEPVRPDEGHKPAKLAAGGGCRTESCFGELGWRSAYHDLMDNDDGYVAGAQINFFQITARHYVQKPEQTRLESFRVIDIISLSPWSHLLRPVSWEVASGVERRTRADGSDRLAAFINGGAGLAARIGNALIYGMAEGELDAGNSYPDGYSVSTGCSLGAVGSVSDWWKLRLDLKGLMPVAGEPYRTIKGEVRQNITINRDNSIALNMSREKTVGWYRTEATVSWNYYY